MIAGRPLRFLAVTLGGWTALRVVMLWPSVDSVPALIRAIVPPDAAATRPDAVPAPIRPRPMPVTAFAPAAGSRSAPAPVVLALDGPAPVESPTPRPADLVPAIPPPLRPTPAARPPARLSGSAWAIARGGRSDTLLGGQLGASQAGVRVAYALGEARTVALTARVATPLRGRGREAAIGVEWRPRGVPVRVVAEQRIALDGGRGGPTIGIVGGIDPTPIARGFRLEAYGQAGAIAHDRVEGFADAAARLTRPVTRGIDFGIGAWGGAQRGAARLDIGPTIGIVLPAGPRRLRMTLDWRQRVAGSARPGSGPALSLGSDF